MAVLFLSHLAHVTEEVRFVDGIEQPCLVIPTVTNQIDKGRTGNWMLHFIFKEQPPNPKGYTHIMQLIYKTPKHTAEAKRKGIWKPTMRMGRLYEHLKTKELTIDRTNHATDIRLDGILVLSDIPKRRLRLNKNTGKRLLENLTIKSFNDDRIIYTGAVCVDDIPKDRIKTNPDNGKKYVHVRFKKMERFDAHENTHRLILVSDNGSELEIGLFKEWVKDGRQSTPPNPENEIHDTGVNQRQTPESIDGHRF